MTNTKQKYQLIWGIESNHTKNSGNLTKVKSRFNRTLKLSEILKLYMQDLIIKQNPSLIPLSKIK
jgi:hypothetical protein